MKRPIEKILNCNFPKDWKLGNNITNQYAKEALILKKVHFMWESFWTAFRKVKNLSTTKISSIISSMKNLEEDPISKAVIDAIKPEVWRVAKNCHFEGIIGRDAWLNGKIIYNAISNNEKASTNLGSVEYFTNLVKVLDEQTKIVKVLDEQTKNLKVLDEQTKNLKAVQ